MKKNVCKSCGSSEYYFMGSGEKRCKCGKPINKKKPAKTGKFDSKTQAEFIAKISLLKRKIDQCLDERDQEGFHKYVFELKVCQRYIKMLPNYKESNLKKRLEDNFLNN